MSKYLYLSVIPESLIASMLPPREFGDYMATGTKKRNTSQAIFFEIDIDKVSTLIDMEYINQRCIRKADGTPKSSVYLSTYKVLEMIPLNSLKNLYVTTETGVVLELKKSAYDKSSEVRNALHLYQELCPVSPRVASSFSPSEFLTALTDGSMHVNVPKLFFVDLKLGELATNPMSGSAEQLPYRNVGHLRDCLEILMTEEKKQIKTVQRTFSGSLLYRTINSGFYIGDRDDIIHYSFPSMTELEDKNYDFFRSI
ncbi:MAG: hypothetical protein ABSG89_03520 [Bacteroidales bacterium]|jgi:hypothetical protein